MKFFLTAALLSLSLSSFAAPECVLKVRKVGPDFAGKLEAKTVTLVAPYLVTDTLSGFKFSFDASGLRIQKLGSILEVTSAYVVKTPTASVSLLVPSTDPEMGTAASLSCTGLN